MCIVKVLMGCKSGFFAKTPDEMVLSNPALAATSSAENFSAKCSLILGDDFLSHTRVIGEFFCGEMKEEAVRISVEYFGYQCLPHRLS